MIMKTIIFYYFIAFGATEFILEENDTSYNSKYSTEKEGIKTEVPVAKIVGGEVTPIDLVPYMAALLRSNRLVCGASIVSTRYVVTAAHCFYRNPYTRGLYVRVGSDYYERGGETRFVVRIYKHPDYTPHTGDNDCAVLRVDIPFSRRYPYQELSLSTSDPRYGDILDVSGWGYTSEGGQFSPDLKSISVLVLPDDFCNLAYSEMGWVVPPNSFCAGNILGDDSCKGDSGGPAVYNSTVLVGIVSFGLGCGRPGVPGVYTNVARVQEWIRKIITGY